MAFNFGIAPIANPADAQRTRAIANALISRPPATNWAEGLAALTGGFAANQLNSRASDAERAGQASAAEALSRLSGGGTQADIISALSNPWTTPQQASVASALLGQQMERSDPLYQLRLRQAQLDYDQDKAGVVDGAGEYGLTPIWGTMPDGSFAYGVQGKDGSFLPVDTGDIAPLDPRSLAGEKAAGTAEGKSAAELAVAAPGDIAQADTALDLIRQIETHPEKPWATGFSAGIGGNAIPGTGRYGFQNLVEQAKSGAFLTAIDDMRGLGALSNAEGGAATQAITRINTALSEADFDKALADYKAIVLRGRDRAARRVRVDENGNETPIDSSAPSQPAGGGVVDWTEYFKGM